MSGEGVEAGIVAYLSGLSSHVTPHMGEMRKRIGCTSAELKEEIGRMRMRGKILWDRLALSPSMIDEPAPGATERETATSGPMSAVPPDPDGGCDPEFVAGEGAGGEILPPAPEPVEADPLAGRAHLLSPPDQLLRDVDAWCKRTETKETLIGAVLFRHPGFIGLVRARRMTSPDRIAAVRKLLAENPDGLSEQDRPSHNLRVPKALPAPAPAPAAEPEAVATEEAAAITVAIKDAIEDGVLRDSPSGRRHRIPPASALELGELSTIEKLQTLLVEDPEDLIRAVGRTHSHLWRRCIALGRVVGERPGVALYRALGAGLDQLERDLVSRG